MLDMHQFPCMCLSHDFATMLRHSICDHNYVMTCKMLSCCMLTRKPFVSRSLYSDSVMLKE